MPCTYSFSVTRTATEDAGYFNPERYAALQEPAVGVDDGGSAYPRGLEQAEAGIVAGGGKQSHKIVGERGEAEASMRAVDEDLEEVEHCDMQLDMGVGELGASIPEHT